MISEKFLCLTCDGTTCSGYTGEEYESLFVRSCVNGKISEQFLTLPDTLRMQDLRFNFPKFSWGFMPRGSIRDHQPVTDIFLV